MTFSRRECCLLLLPALPVILPASPAALGSKTYRFEDLPVRKNGANSSRAVLDGATHEGSAVEIHETELASGSQPHPPHKHVHEEIFMVREGAVEVTIAGQSTTLGAGGIAFIGSNDMHGIRNTGAVPAQYFVIALGTKQTS